MSSWGMGPQVVHGQHPPADASVTPETPSELLWQLHSVGGGGGRVHTCHQELEGFPSFLAHVFVLPLSPKD